MNTHPSISLEQLNAFLDNELDDDERAQVLSALRNDKGLSGEYAQLQQLNALMPLAYHDLPGGSLRPPGPRPSLYPLLRVAAVLAILAIGSLLGWFLHHPASPVPDLPFTSLAQLNLNHPADNKILIHINAMDNTRINTVLRDTEQLLHNAKRAGKPLQLEIVANASGLGMLRQGSPYTHRIHQIVANNKNVRFLACGFAMENARLKEGRAIKLIPDAHKVDAALEQILRRLKAGWLYVRG